MAKTTMSVAQALLKTKTAEKRLAELTKRVYVAVQDKGGKLRLEKNFNDRALADWQTWEQLNKNVTNLRAAIVDSNAKTTVEIGGETMTVAAAIGRKTRIAQEQSMLDALAQQLSAAENAVVQGNRAVQIEVDKLAAAAYNKEADAADVNSFIADQVARRQYSLTDPINVVQKIEALRERIAVFTENVDLVLTTSNVVTMIEVDL